ADRPGFGTRRWVSGHVKRQRSHRRPELSTFTAARIDLSIQREPEDRLERRVDHWLDHRELDEIASGRNEYGSVRSGTDHRRHDLYDVPRPSGRVPWPADLDVLFLRRRYRIEPAEATSVRRFVGKHEQPSTVEPECPRHPSKRRRHCPFQGRD